jgi:hypothetical protein
MRPRFGRCVVSATIKAASGAGSKLTERLGQKKPALQHTLSLLDGGKRQGAIRDLQEMRRDVEQRSAAFRDTTRILRECLVILAQFRAKLDGAR